MDSRTRHRTQVVVAAAVSAILAAVSIWLHTSDRLGAVRDFTRAWVVASADADATIVDSDGPYPLRLWPTDETEQSVSAPAGGALALPGGLGALTIPRGAAPHDVTLRAVQLFDEQQQEVVVDLQPDGLALRRPARLELAVPAGLAADETEIAVFDPRRRAWMREENQAAAPDGRHLVTLITHLSLRRVRIRPGMAFPSDPRRARGVFFLESDPSNTFEKLIDGRWQVIDRKSATLRELTRSGRRARGDLIASGRLRAIVPGPDAGEALSDALRQVVLPATAPAARTGWVRITRLDSAGARTGRSTIARVLRSTGSPGRSGAPVVRMSRAVMEALGLAWGAEFGLSPQNPELTVVRLESGGDQAASYVPILLEPWTPAPAHGR